MRRKPLIGSFSEYLRVVRVISLSRDSVQTHEERSAAFAVGTENWDRAVEERARRGWKRGLSPADAASLDARGFPTKWNSQIETQAYLRLL